MALTIESFSPTAAHAGERVTVTGTGFINPTVQFNNISAYIVSYNSTTIVTRVPLTASSGLITVVVEMETVPSSTNFEVTSYGPSGPIAGNIGKLRDLDIIFVKYVSGKRGRKIMGITWTDDADFFTPDDENTISHLHFDGDQDQLIFTDERDKIWTPTPVAYIDTNNTKFGSGCGAMVGGGCISTPMVDNFNILNKDATIERFAKNIVPGDTIFWCGYGSTYYSLTYPVSGILRFTTCDDGTIWSFDGTVPASVVTDFEITKEIWHHITFVKHNNIYSIYVDGNNIVSDYNDDGIPNISNLGTFQIGG